MPSPAPTTEHDLEKSSSAAEHGLEKNSSTFSDDSQLSIKKEEWKPTRAFFLAVSPLLLLALMVSLDATILAVALPQMSVELNGTALESFWAGTSFLLASASLLPTIAAMSNIFGRKPVSVDFDGSMRLDLAF